MISKELLNEVLNVEIYGIEIPRDFLDSNTDHITIWFNEYERSRINIHELAHKCKEWALDNGYEIVSRILSSDHQKTGHCYIVKCEYEYEKVIKIFNEKTEPEAIFKSCQWILENK